MFSISDLLARHPIPGIREAEKRRVCAEALKELVGVTVRPAHIQYDSGVLTLSVPPVLKSAILVNQKKLKAALSERGLTLTQIR